jgi:hypothetical protein
MKILQRYFEKKIFQNQTEINKTRNWEDLKVYQTCNRDQLDNNIICENLCNTKSIFSDLYIYDDIHCDQYIKSKSDFLWKIFNMIQNEYGAMKADFFRYIVMYYEGGLYLDIKSGVKENVFLKLEESVKMYVANWVEFQHRKWGKHPELKGKAEFVQWFILTKPENPILRDIIILMCLKIIFYHKWFHGVGRSAVLNITGPILFSEVIYRNLNREISIVDYRKLNLYYSVFEEKELDITHREINTSHYTTQISKPVKYSFLKRLIILIKG